MARRAISIVPPIPALALHPVVSRISFLIVDAKNSGSTSFKSETSKNASSQLTAYNPNKQTLVIMINTSNWKRVFLKADLNFAAMPMQDVIKLISYLQLNCNVKHAGPTRQHTIHTQLYLFVGFKVVRNNNKLRTKVLCMSYKHTCFHS